MDEQKKDKPEIKVIKPGRRKDGSGFMIMPAKPGTCAMCARGHPPEQPHDLHSIFYGVRFKMKYERDPTWADASAHCTPEIRDQRKEGLRSCGYEWTSPTDREPIREPYAMSDPSGESP